MLDTRPRACSQCLQYYPVLTPCAPNRSFARRLLGDDPLYLMRVPGAPDVRLIVRTGGPDGLPLLIEDVVRPGNVLKVFKAHNV